MDESQEVPFRILEDRSGHAVPWYMLRYDANGTCLGRRSAAQVLAAVSTQTYSDIFLFCHGWNNDWPAALARYTSFIDGVSGFPRGASIGRAFEPLLVGLTWPSTALTFWDERGPAIAGEADASGGVDLSAIPTSESALVMEALRAAAGIPLEHARRLAQSLARIVPALGGDDEAVKSKQRRPSMFSRRGPPSPLPTMARECSAPLDGIWNCGEPTCCIAGSWRLAIDAEGIRGILCGSSPFGR